VGWTLRGDETSRERSDRVRISARDGEHKEPNARWPLRVAPV
jgi:hypothetical protein